MPAVSQRPCPGTPPARTVRRCGPVAGACGSVDREGVALAQVADDLVAVLQDAALPVAEPEQAK
ncbi:hypothetical protein GCM10025868_03720 [Angustibacter aerolatus]|uniref:Uncharacterized protein n=1 Tax=Angustibacter aerolatus TaxID=1162965 RepID=A0ABQ6JAB3_9ACTN|nr:hypothetical protein GCM10025868_03720 [Angustibacter aerolatus]